MVPDSVKIGPFLYTVKVESVASLEPAQLGCTDVARTTITVLGGMSASQERATVLHECLHALLSLTGWDHRLGDPDCEHLVRALEPALLAFLIDNPKVVRWLTR